MRNLLFDLFSFFCVLWVFGCTSATSTTAKLSATAETLAVGSNCQLTATPNGATWATSNAAVATVSLTGLVTGIGQGTATITATSNNTSASCTITVGSIYVPGCVWSTAVSGGPFPVYWKDGSPVELGLSGGYEAELIAVSGSTVYAAGQVTSTGLPVWWNGSSWQSLPGVAAANYIITGMAISGSTVYITATVWGSPQSGGYWANGLWTQLLGSGTVVGVVVAGGHIYMAGTDETNSATTGSVPVYWTDGSTKEQSLPQGTEFGNQNGAGFIACGEGNNTPIVASGSDVYIAGNTWDWNGTASTAVPIVWKNFQILYQGTFGTSYHALSLAVNGSNVYVVGATDSSASNWVDTNTCTAVSWKNGIPTLLSNSSQTTAFLIAAGADIYAAGEPTYPWGETNPLTPLFWKDGSSAIFSYVGSDTNARVQAMLSVGNDVFIYGATGMAPTTPTGDFNYSYPVHAVYWKDGTLTQLSVAVRVLIVDSGSVGYGIPYLSLP